MQGDQWLLSISPDTCLALEALTHRRYVIGPDEAQVAGQPFASVEERVDRLSYSGILVEMSEREPTLHTGFQEVHPCANTTGFPTTGSRIGRSTGYFSWPIENPLMNGFWSAMNTSMGGTDAMMAASMSGP